MEGGKWWVLAWRVRIVTVKLWARSWVRIAGPRVPVAWRALVLGRFERGEVGRGDLLLLERLS